MIVNSVKGSLNIPLHWKLLKFYKIYKYTAQFPTIYEYNTQTVKLGGRATWILCMHENIDLQDSVGKFIFNQEKLVTNHRSHTVRRALIYVYKPANFRTRIFFFLITRFRLQFIHTPKILSAQLAGKLCLICLLGISLFMTAFNIKPTLLAASSAGNHTSNGFIP